MRTKRYGNPTITNKNMKMTPEQRQIRMTLEAECLINVPTYSNVLDVVMIKDEPHAIITCLAENKHECRSFAFVPMGEVKKTSGMQYISTVIKDDVAFCVYELYNDK